MAQPILDFEDADESGPMPGPGCVLGNKYLLTRIIGQGGMGVVYEAVHQKLRQRVAVKLPRPQALEQRDTFAEFEREARATSRIPSPHVARVFDVDATPEGHPYMVMELLEGRDLESELQARGALPMRESVDWILQACSALSDAHRAGIVHRDLKPSNLFLARRGERVVVKVLDFGIASDGDDDGNASPIGTPAYMAPEQVRGAKDVDGRADVFALGVILYEMLVGAPPFHGTTTAAIAALVGDAKPELRAKRRDVPEALDRIIKKACAKKPEDRFADVDAFATALARYGSDDALSGPFSYRPTSSHELRVVPLDMLGRAPRSHRRVAGMLLGGIAAAAVALLTMHAFAKGRAPDEAACAATSANTYR